MPILWEERVGLQKFLEPDIRDGIQSFEENVHGERTNSLSMGDFIMKSHTLMVIWGTLTVTADPGHPGTEGAVTTFVIYGRTLRQEPAVLKQHRIKLTPFCKTYFSQFFCETLREVKHTYLNLMEGVARDS